MLADAANPLLTLPPSTLCIFGAALVVWLAMMGLSLKVAFKVTGADPPGYFTCLGYALLLPIVNALITSVAYATVGPLLGLVGIFQLYVQIKILMAAGNCGGWTAFFSGIVHGLFSAFATVLIALAVLYSGVIDPEEVKGKVQLSSIDWQAQSQATESVATEPKSNRSFLPWGTPRTADGAQINPYAE